MREALIPFVIVSLAIGLVIGLCTAMQVGCGSAPKENGVPLWCVNRAK